MSGRISTYGTQQDQLLTIQSLQKKQAENQVALTSGVKHDSILGFGSESGDILGLRADEATNQTYKSKNTQDANRFNVMVNQCEQLTHIASQLSTTLSQNQLSPQQGQGIQYQRFLQSIAGALNQKYNKQYLFSGTATQTIPVNLNNISGLDQENTDYYDGNTQPATYLLEDRRPVVMNITAASPGFEKLLRAAKLAMDNPTDVAVLQRSQELCNLAITDISNHTVDIGLLPSEIETVEESLDARILMTKISLADLTQTNFGQARTDYEMADIGLTYSSVYTKLSLARLRELAGSI